MDEMTGTHMHLERDGSEVCITIRCNDDYAAMLLYDRINRDMAANGSFKLHVHNIKRVPRQKT